MSSMHSYWYKPAIHYISSVPLLNNYPHPKFKIGIMNLLTAKEKQLQVSSAHPVLKWCCVTFDSNTKQSTPSRKNFLFMNLGQKPELQSSKKFLIIYLFNCNMKRWIFSQFRRAHLKNSMSQCLDNI